MTVDVTISLEPKTCYQGHVYAVPNWIQSHRYKCPMCANLEINNLRDQLDNDYLEMQHLQRSISSLKGVITKLKKHSI